MDIDWGYTGRLQFVLVKQTNAGDHIVESDNTNADATVGYLTTPRSTPKVANFTFLSNGSDEAMKYKEGVSGIYMNGIVKSTGAKGCIEHTKLETLQDAPGYDKIAHHSVFMDCGTGKTYAAGDDSATDAELKASIEERVTNTTVGGTSTLVGTYFLGENESNITSAFNNVQAVCAVGSHAAGSTTTLCPTYSTRNLPTQWTHGLGLQITLGLFLQDPMKTIIGQLDGLQAYLQQLIVLKEQRRQRS